jgi:hypothetical protein
MLARCAGPRGVHRVVGERREVLHALFEECVVAGDDFGDVGQVHLGRGLDLPVLFLGVHLEDRGQVRDTGGERSARRPIGRVGRLWSSVLQSGLLTHVGRRVGLTSRCDAIYD